MTQTQATATMLAQGKQSFKKSALQEWYESVESGAIRLTKDERILFDEAKILGLGTKPASLTDAKRMIRIIRDIFQGVDYTKGL